MDTSTFVMLFIVIIIVISCLNIKPSNILSPSITIKSILVPSTTISTIAPSPTKPTLAPLASVLFAPSTYTSYAPAFSNSVPNCSSNTAVWVGPLQNLSSDSNCICDSNEIRLSKIINGVVYYKCQLNNQASL